MKCLDELLDTIVLKNSCLPENVEASADDGDRDEEENYMHIFDWCASDTFESELFKDISSPLMSISSSDEAVDSQPGYCCSMMCGGRRDESPLQHIASVSGRHNREHVNIMWAIYNSLKTNENQFNH